MKVNITEILGGRFDCPCCCASDGWTSTARTQVRQYSRIHRLRCVHCGEQIVAKAIGGRYSREYARVHARREYEALGTLQTAFPQDERYGTLVPLGYLEYAGCGVVITRLAPGDELTRYLRTLDTAGAQAACGTAGVWLRKLHESDAQIRQASIGAEEKIADLTDEYGAVLRDDPATRAVCELWTRQGARVDAVTVLAVRQHGDFKPDNLLCDGTRCVGLDIVWRTVGAAVYDLAPFLNHLWLAARGRTAGRRESLYDLEEIGFLAGYGGIVDVHALRWTQLYFALHHLAKHRQRGRLAAGYAGWKFWPLVQRLARQLQEAA